MAVDPAQAQRFGPCLGENLFEFTPGSFAIVGGNVGLERNGRERISIDLSIRSERQALQLDEVRRNHVIGKGHFEGAAVLIP